MMNCPRCNAEYEDHDGFGVIHCETCGYCTHPSATGNICDLCGRDYRESDPVVDAITVDQMRSELASELSGIIGRLSVACADIESAKRLLGTDAITIAERACSHTRILIGQLRKLQEEEL